MNINLTKNQFFNLMKLIYIGNWIANANRTDDRNDIYDELESYIFSFAKEFGLEQYADDDSDDNKIFPTRIFEEETDVHDLIDEYEDEAFWDKLTDRLVDRDLILRFGVDGLAKMKDGERWYHIVELENYYSSEFYKNGLENIEIKKR